MQYKFHHQNVTFPRLQVQSFIGDVIHIQHKRCNTHTTQAHVRVLAVGTPKVKDRKLFLTLVACFKQSKKAFRPLRGSRHKG